MKVYSGILQVINKYIWAIYYVHVVMGGLRSENAKMYTNKHQFSMEYYVCLSLKIKHISTL